MKANPPRAGITLGLLLSTLACSVAAQLPPVPDVPPDVPTDVPPDADALSLADQAPAVPQPARDWRVFIEAAGLRNQPRGSAPAVDALRTSADLLYDAKPAPGLRTVLSDRLDLTHSGTNPRQTNVNTLREAYLSWQVNPDEIVDAGRVNLRFGSAMGYNPTDFFKAGALRSIVSPAPASLRENRLGSVVLQGQKLWNDGSLAAVYSPALAHHPSDAAFSLDLGSTNARQRWLLAASHQFSEGFNPQALLYGGAGTPTQAGLNLSTLVNDATVAYGEFAAGRGLSLGAQALGLPEGERWQRRGAVGFTVTTSFNLSITAEAEFNCAAPTRAQWAAWRAVSPFSGLRLLGTAQELQDLPARQAWFFYATWQDMLVKHLDLSAFARTERTTHSRSEWLELSYHWDRVDAAVQWQLNEGSPGSIYGMVPQQRGVQALLRVYL